jgi:ribose transport system ATP-binding protein
MEAPVLALQGLVRRFGGTVALDGVDFEVFRGQIHALLGENGAGKTTLIKILAGVHKADAGRILLDGREVEPQREALPIAFIHQDLGLVDSMTVAENIALVTGYPRRLGLIRWQEVRRIAGEAVRTLGVLIDPDARVGSLRAAERSLIAIARALAVPSAVLVLDEPTAALPEADVKQLLDVLDALRARGLAIIYVTHRLDEVFRIANRVTVLRDGRKVAGGPVSDFDARSLVEAIVGRRLSELFVRAHDRKRELLLDVKNLVTVGAGPLSLQVHRGEITALVGLRGAGHHAAARAIFGDQPRARGTVRIGSQNVPAGDPAAAVAAGIGFVSSNRSEESVALNLTIQENLFMNLAATSELSFLVGLPTETACAVTALRRCAVRPPRPERIIITLSGGNQQKVVLARWLEANMQLLILEEPTFGVDVGSKAEIYRLLAEVVEHGRGVLLVSSDLEEVAGIAHRALVFDRGSIVSEVPGETLTIENLTELTGGGQVSV